MVQCSDPKRRSMSILSSKSKTSIRAALALTLAAALPASAILAPAPAVAAQGDLDRASEIGFEIHEISPAQRELWKSATADVAPRLLDTIGPQAEEIYRIVQQGKRAFAKARRDGQSQ